MAARKQEIQGINDNNQHTGMSGKRFSTLYLIYKEKNNNTNLNLKKIIFTFCGRYG